MKEHEFDGLLHKSLQDVVEPNEFPDREATWKKIQEKVAQKPVRKGSKWVLRSVFLVAAVMLLCFSFYYFIPPKATIASQRLIQNAKQITIQFSKLMDRPSVRDAVKVFPATDYRLKWEGDKQLAIIFPQLVPGSSYNLIISRKAEDEFGTGLAHEISINFYGPERVTSQSDKNNVDAHIVRTKTIEWQQDKVQQIQQGIANGHYTSRLTPEHAAMDDLQKNVPDWPKTYQMPALVSTNGRLSFLKAESKQGNGFLTLTMKQLAAKGKHGAWFLTRIEWWETK